MFVKGPSPGSLDFIIFITFHAKTVNISSSRIAVNVHSSKKKIIKDYGVLGGENQ